MLQRSSKRSALNALLVVALGISLAACANKAAVRSLDGASQLFTAPEFAIKGKTANDQAWIDDTIESGVGGLGWHRPQPRPASWDMPVKAPVKAKPKKKPLWKRALGR